MSIHEKGRKRERQVFRTEWEKETEVIEGNKKSKVC